MRLTPRFRARTLRRPMTTIPLYEMRLEEADACVVAVRSEREPVRRVRLAQTFLSDPALPREQRKAI